MTFCCCGLKTFFCSNHPAEQILWSVEYNVIFFSLLFLLFPLGGSGMGVIELKWLPETSVSF